MGKPKRFNAYDSTVKAKRLEVQSYGAQRQRLSINSSFRGQPLEPPIATVLSSDESTGTGTFCSASLAADQTTNIAATDHIEFDTLDEDGGITLQTGVGQADGIFELSAGKKYYLTGAVRPEFSGATGQLVMAWYDITNTAELGKRAIYESQTHASNNADQPKAEIVITPTTNITIEFRIIAVTALTALATEYSQVTIFEIALGGSSGSGSGGGGSGVSFPITPTINDHGNVGTTTEDLDLSAATGHVHKITLTGDPTLTFSNPPSSGTQIEFEIEFVQDGTGSRTVTWPATVAETVSISKTASSTTIVTVRTNDGGTTYHAIPALRGSISLSGGSNYANTALSNLVSPTLTTDLNFNTYDLTNLDRGLLSATAGGALVATDVGFTSDASGNFEFNAKSGASHIFRVAINATASLAISETGLISQTIIPVGTDDLGSSVAPWDKGYITDIVFAATAKANKLIFDGDPTTPLTYLSGSGVTGRCNFYSEIAAADVNVVSIVPEGILITGDRNLELAQGYIRLSDRADPTAPTGLSEGIFYIKDDGAGISKPYFIGDGQAATDLTAPLSISDGDTTVVVNDTGKAATTTIDGTQAFTVGNGRTDWNDHHDLYGAASFQFYDTTDASVATTITQNQTELAINFPTSSDALNLYFNSTLGFSVDESRTRVHSTVANTTAAILSIYRDDPSPTALDVTSIIKFDGENSTGSLATYCQIDNIAGVVTAGSEDADLNFKTTETGTLVTTWAIGGGSGTIRQVSSTASDRANLTLLKEDATPTGDDVIGGIKFNLLDSPTTTTYVDISAEIRDATDAGRLLLKVRADNSSLNTALEVEGDDNNARSYMKIHSRIAQDLEFGVETGATDLVIKPTVNTLSFQTSTSSISLGAVGTIQLPTKNGSSSTAAQADTDFGDAIGCVGLYTNDTSNVHLLVTRQASGNWAGVILTDNTLV